MKKKILSILLTAAMVVGLLPISAVSVSASENPVYLEYVQGIFYEQNMPDGYIPLSEASLGYPMTLGSDGTASWYYADENKAYNSTVYAAGDVNIVLKDGVTVDFNEGLVTSGEGSITIYAQSSMPDTAGTVNAVGPGGSAAIGSDMNQTGGTLSIKGGNINASAEEDAPAIGAGFSSSDFTVNIYGGIIDAVGGENAAGIGAGVLCENISVNIFGGFIIAEGGTVIEDGETTEYPAIGAGNLSDCTVDGGLCHFTYYSGRGASVKADTFAGLHIVTMIRSDTERHLVKTHYPKVGATVFEDGTLNTAGHKEYFECYCGSYYEDSKCLNKIDNLAAWKAGDGIVLVPEDVTVTFDLNYSEENRIYATETLTPPAVCSSPEAPTRDGYSFGGWYIYSSCEDGCKFDFSRKVVEDTTLYAKWTTGGYYYHRFGHNELTYGPLPENLITLTSSMTTLGKDGEGTWYFADTSFDVTSRVTVQGNVHIILKNGVTVNYTKGIGVDKSYRGIDIYAQSLDPDVAGTLIATGSNQSAGIGSGNETDCGIISVHSGNVIATGAQYGAGIGGGDINRGGTVQIYGGNITATGGDNAAGIGTGYKSSNQFDIIIIGGTINAKGGTNAAGIGGGSNAKNVRVDISGGNINAQGGNNGAGIGSGNSGSDVTVEITAGYIDEACGGKNGAGIGSGNAGNAAVAINGNCTITARGGVSGAGIGSGYKAKATVEMLSINRSRFTGGSYASSSQYANGVGAGEGATCDLKLAACVLSITSSGNGIEWVERIPNSKHTFKTVIPATPPVYDEDGVGIISPGIREYYQCQCGFYFSDKECTKLIGTSFDLERWKGDEGIDNDTYGVYFNWQRNSQVTAVAVKPGNKVQPIWPGDGGSYVVGWYTDSACTAGNEFDFSQPINEAVTQLYAKWVDNCYLAYDETSHELIPREVPKDIKKVTYSGSGDLYLGEYSTETGVPEEEQWYYVQGKIVVDGKINVFGNVHLILYDGCTLQGNYFNGMIGGNLNLYGQSKDTQTMGKLISGVEEDYGIILSGDFNIHGGYVTVKGGNTSSPVAIVVKAAGINVYGGSLDLEGTHYVSIIGGHAYEIPTVALMGNLHIDSCMLDIYAEDGDGDVLFTDYGKAHILKTEMKSARVHTLAKTTEEILPYIDGDGNIVDGVRAYYTCGCGYNYSDETLTQRIGDIDLWKQGGGKLVGHKVTFDLDYDGISTVTVVADGRALTAPTDPERELYDFLGWYDVKGNEWNFDTKIKGDTTLIAHWNLAHVHEWSQDWSYDDENHWHICISDDCPVTDVSRMDAYGEHIMENFVCTVCGREDLDGAKEYAYGVIDAEVAKCPSEVHMAEAVEMGEAAKASVALCETVAQVYDILATFAEQMIIPTYAVTYFDENGEEKTVSDYRLLKDSDDTVLTLEEGKWYVAESSVTVGKVIAVSGDVHMILRDAVTVTAEKGIAVSEKNALTVYSESLTGNMGALVTSGKSCAAGIGGYLDLNSDEPVPGGTVVINGGNITARGGLGAAGIGGGFCSDGGDVIINNGYVAAYGNAGGAGIGGGHYGANGTVTVNGGTVEAYGADDAAGIGGGYAGEGGSVTVNGVEKLIANGFRGIGAGKLCAASAIVTDVDDALIVKAGEDAENAVVVEKLTEEEYIEIILDLIGDVNRDGKVNILDVNLVTTMILGRIMEAVNADLDGDGKVNAKDINLLKKIVVGMK